MIITVDHDPKCCRECHFYGEEKPNGNGSFIIGMCAFLRRYPSDTVVGVEKDAACPFDSRNKKNHILMVRSVKK